MGHRLLRVAQVVGSGGAFKCVLEEYRVSRNWSSVRNMVRAIYLHIHRLYSMFLCYTLKHATCRHVICSAEADSGRHGQASKFGQVQATAHR